MKIYKSLDQIEWNWDWIVSFYKDILSDPRSFFESGIFKGDVSRSLWVIGSVTLLGGVLSLSGAEVSIIRAMQSTVHAMLSISLFAGVLHFFKDFIETSGRFSNFLRFYAYISALSLPIILIGVLFPFLMGLLYLSLFILSIWGFIIAFKINVSKFLVVFLGFLILQVVFSYSIFRPRF